MLLKDNFIHADLHPGNILVRLEEPAPAGTLRGALARALRLAPHPRLVLLDVGMIARLTSEDQSHLVDFFKVGVEAFLMIWEVSGVVFPRDSGIAGCVEAMAPGRFVLQGALHPHAAPPCPTPHVCQPRHPTLPACSPSPTWTAPLWPTPSWPSRRRASSAPTPTVSPTFVLHDWAC